MDQNETNSRWNQFEGLLYFLRKTTLEEEVQAQQPTSESLEIKGAGTLAFSIVEVQWKSSRVVEICEEQNGRQSAFRARVKRCVGPVRY